MTEGSKGRKDVKDVMEGRKKMKEGSNGRKEQRSKGREGKT